MSTLRSVLLPTVVVLLAQQAWCQSDLGHPVAPWDENYVPIQSPDSASEFGGTAGINSWSWSTYCDGQSGIGDVYAEDMTTGQAPHPNDEAAKVRLESWIYVGAKRGHIEATVVLRGDALAYLEGAATGAEAVGLGAYTSNTGGTVFVEVAVAAKTSGVVIWEGTFHLGLWSVSIPVYATLGEGTFTGADESGLNEWVCTNYWSGTTKTKVRVEAFADGNGGGPLVKAEAEVGVEISGTVLLCELYPEQCP